MATNISFISRGENPLFHKLVPRSMVCRPFGSSWALPGRNSLDYLVSRFYDRRDGVEDIRRFLLVPDEEVQNGGLVIAGYF